MRLCVASAPVLLVACGSPSVLCPTDTEGTPQTGCVVPSADIVIDGELDDWATLPPTTALPCSDCDDDDVTFVRGVRTTGDRIAFLLTTPGTPTIAVDHGYNLALAPLDGPGYLLEVTIDAETAWRYLNVDPIEGLPVEYAFTASGVELAIARTALPFGGGAWMYGEHYVLEDNAWSFAQLTIPAAAVCWDRESVVCRAAAQ